MLRERSLGSDALVAPAFGRTGLTPFKRESASRAAAGCAARVFAGTKHGTSRTRSKLRYEQLPPPSTQKRAQWG